MTSFIGEEEFLLFWRGEGGCLLPPPLPTNDPLEESFALWRCEVVEGGVASRRLARHRHPVCLRGHVVCLIGHPVSISCNQIGSVEKKYTFKGQNSLLIALF